MHAPALIVFYLAQYRFQFNPMPLDATAGPGLTPDASFSVSR
jgi:hypothetical protein